MIKNTAEEEKSIQIFKLFYKICKSQVLNQQISWSLFMESLDPGPYTWVEIRYL